MGKSKYSESFRKQAVEKFLNRGGKSSQSIAKDLGVSIFTLYRWSKKMSSNHLKTKPKHHVDKFETLLSFLETLPSKQGEFLRSKGLTTDQMALWKNELKSKLDDKESSLARNESLQSTRRIKDLEKEIRRKDKVLAETTALLVLSKKAEALWGTNFSEE